MTVMPCISVIMPVYNCENFIFEAVNSILQQTYSDFELLIIDDASTDNTVSIIEQINDYRIILIKKDSNTGYTNSLNIGLKIAKGKYIARMDGDDISLPLRFEKQVNCLEQNSDIAVCGTWYQLSGTNIIHQHPSKSEDIKLALLECCSLGHPTVMFCKSIIDEYALEYDRNMEPAEDYDLWVKIIRHKKIVNIPEVLLLYRLHSNQVSVIRKLKQQANAQRARIKLIGYLYDDLPVINITEEMDMSDNAGENKKQLFSFIREVQKVKTLNNEKCFFEPSRFQRFIDNKKRLAIQNFFNHPNTSGWENLWLFLFNKNLLYRNFKNSDKLKVILKSLFFIRNKKIFNTNGIK
jgi:glycosyltransferase involved in cell wall biosynthesis